MATDCCAKTQEAHQFLRDERTAKIFSRSSWCEIPSECCYGLSQWCQHCEKENQEKSKKQTFTTEPLVYISGWDGTMQTRQIIKHVFVYTTGNKVVLHILCPFPFSEQRLEYLLAPSRHGWINQISHSQSLQSEIVFAHASTMKVYSFRI